jgi:hypothetical protein
MQSKNRDNHYHATTPTIFVTPVSAIPDAPNAATWT